MPVPELIDSNTLETQDQYVIAIAGLTGQGDTDAMVETFKHLLPENQVGGYEAVLQTHLFAGYARTFNALMALDKAGFQAPEENTEPSFEQGQHWYQKGDRFCGEVYGLVYPKLRRNAAKWHPAMDRWMVEFGYGRVLTRPGLSSQIRELCVLVVLAGLDVPVQVRSHVYGCLNVGCTQDMVRGCALLAQKIWENASAHALLASLDGYFSRYTVF